MIDNYICSFSSVCLFSRKCLGSLRRQGELTFYMQPHMFSKVSFLLLEGYNFLMKSLTYNLKYDPIWNLFFRFHALVTRMTCDFLLTSVFGPVSLKVPFLIHNTVASLLLSDLKCLYIASFELSIRNKTQCCLVKYVQILLFYSVTLQADRHLSLQKNLL